jgi:hypothetical protein
MGLQMKKVLLLIFMLLSVQIIKAAKPVVEVPDLPANSELELYEESEGIFALKILELYKNSVALETQLKLNGITPKTKVIQPTIEELEDMDIKIIKKYFNITKSLQDEVLASPESDRQELLEKINELNSTLRDTIAIYTIEQGKIRNEMLDLMIKRLKLIEKTNSENIELAINQNFVNCMDYQNWFSAAVMSKLFISNGNDVIKNDPGLGVQLTLNLSRLTGFWKGFEVKYEYFAPKFFTEYKYDTSPPTREQWNSNVNNISGGGSLIISKSPELIQGLNIFAGYFWADGKIYNRSNSTMNWDGASVSFDYFMGAPSCKYPIELFAGFTVYHSFSRNLIFETPVSGFEYNDLGKTHLAVNVGIRYNIWRSPF